ncbi:hypothetical protein BsWGS_28812 [Bradybaena similaris]
MESRKQNLTVSQIKEIVYSTVIKLKNLKEYHHGDGLRYQKSISDVYWEYCNHRSVIGDYLAELGYAELTVKMLKQMNGLGIFKSDDIWFPTYYTYKTCWNYSDASERLATCLAESGIVKLMTLNLGHTAYLDNIHSKNVYYVLKASLSTLHNIARCAGVLHHFREMKTLEVILPLRNSSDDFLKSMAVLTLVYLVDDKDHAKLVGETNIIKKIITLLQKALEDKQKGKYHGLTATELIQGLSRLAVFDSNKPKIIEDGALDCFLLMLQSLDPREQALCAECVWLLSFDKYVRQTVTDFPDFMNAIENLKDSENQVLRRNICGALWLIKGENDTYASGLRLQNIYKSKNQVFISFSLNERDLVKQLSSDLTAEGYKLWVDWDQTGGSTLQAVVEAAVGSAVVLICMSEGYMQSPACRSEAEFVFHHRKDYIPLLMQRQYSPDGWLSITVGTKPYIDFTGKFPYEKSVQGLLKEMRACGMSSQTAVVNQAPSFDDTGAPRSVPHIAHTATRSVSSTTSSSSLPLSNNGNAALASMSNEHVENWLASKGLHRLTSAFSQIDGQLIWQLKKLRETTPEYFYSILERQFGMTLIDILRFNAALDTLQ